MAAVPSYLGLSGRQLETCVHSLYVTRKLASDILGCSLAEVLLIHNHEILGSSDPVPTEGLVFSIRVQDEAEAPFLELLAPGEDGPDAAWGMLSRLDAIILDPSRIDIRAKNLTGLPGKIGLMCPNLKMLNISFSSLRSLPPELGRLARLEELCLRNNQLPALPAEFLLLRSLRTLDVSRNELKEVNSVPFCVGVLKAGENLILATGDLSRFWQLSVLHLNGNRLKSLRSFLPLPLLTDFRAARNPYLREISCHILEYATYIDISGSAILNLQWKKCKKLQELRLHRSTLSFSKGLDVSTLIHLDMSHSKLTVLPALGEVRGLKTLVACNNNLSSLPGSIGLLSELVVLKLDNNKLRSLPSSVGLLISLSILTLSGNLLHSLPRELLRAKRISELDVSSNPDLMTLPRGLRKQVVYVDTRDCFRLNSIIIGARRDRERS